jgi:hypothetical protein
MPTTYAVTLTDEQDAAVLAEATARAITAEALVTSWATERLEALYRATYVVPPISDMDMDAAAFAEGVVVVTS